MTIYNREDYRTVLPQLEKSIKKLSDRADTLETHDYVVEQGTTSGWVWQKWDSGRYEAEKREDIGTVSLSNAMFTIEGSTKMYASNAIPTTMPTPPHTLKSGSVEVDYLGNSTGYTMLGRTQDDKIQLFRAGSASISVANVILLYRVVNGKWK